MAKKTACYGLMIGVAVICGYVEYIIPFDFGVPGIKLGLANIVALFLLYNGSLVSALSVNVARILLCGLLFGNATGIIYSLCGGISAVLAMFFIKKLPSVTAVGTSVGGAAVHNIGQITAALPLIGFAAARYYLPFLLFSSVVTGVLTGLCVNYINAKTQGKLRFIG